MTLLTKPVRRELPRPMDDRRQWIVSLLPHGIAFRRKRSRRAYEIGWSAIWGAAMKLAAERERQERKARRKAGVK